MTLIKALELFLEYLISINRSPKTLESYKGKIAHFTNYLCRKYNRQVNVEEVTAEDIERFLFDPPNDKRLTNESRYTYANAFKSFYTFCYNKGYCSTNIGSEIAPIKACTKERGFLSEGELLRMVAVLSNETDKAMVQTLFYAGLRIGEAIALTLDDINFKDNYLHIRKQKGRYNRKVPISIKLGLVLENYLENYRDKMEVDSDKVFIYANSGSYSYSKLCRIIKIAANKAGLDMDITSHIMRHSFASNLVAKGVDVVKVRKLLGHESIVTTNIYLHTNMQLLKNAIDTL